MCYLAMFLLHVSAPICHLHGGHLQRRIGAVLVSGSIKSKEYLLLRVKLKTYGRSITRNKDNFPVCTDAKTGRRPRTVMHRKFPRRWKDKIKNPVPNINVSNLNCS